MNFRDLSSGISSKGQEIKAYKTELSHPQYIYLLAGVHGDEVEGVFVLDQFFSFLKKTSDIDLPLVVIPTLNVDGFKEKSRTNANGVDLNRNLPTKNWTSEVKEKKYYPGPHPLSEKENQFLLELFNKYPPSFILSFHSWKPLLNFNGNCEHIAKFLSKHNSYPVEGDVGYPTPGSLGEYGPEKLRVPVLTFELPPYHKDLSLEMIWEENKGALTSLFYSDLLK